MEQPSLNDHNKQEYPPMHTTEHVINRTMVNLFGCGRAISAHIERKKSKLDFALQTCPEEADIIRIENTVNEVLRRNLPVTMEFISQEEAIGRFDMKRLPEKASETRTDCKSRRLRRMPLYRSTREKYVRNRYI